MAGRWKSAQRRKRWSDHAVHLPPGALPQLEPWPFLRPFAQQLASLGQQPSTYAQLALLTNLGKCFLSVLQSSETQEEQARISLGLFVELLFLENSRPLHRGLLSTLSQVPSPHVIILQDAFRQCCLEYGWNGAKERRFSVVAVATSVASLPQPGLIKDVVRRCAASITRTLCHDVWTVLRNALDGGRPTPTAMEECQDALSSIYYFLQHFPDEILGPDSMKNGLTQFGGEFQGRENLTSLSSCEGTEGENGSDFKNVGTSGHDEEIRINGVFANEDPSCSRSVEEGCRAKDGGELYGTVVFCLLDVLQAAVLSRDCLVAAGVGLAAAAQLSASTEGLALELANSIFSTESHEFTILPQTGLSQAIAEKKGFLEAAIVTHRRSSLKAEISKLSEFGKLCFFRGLLTAMPRIIQNFHLLRTTSKCTESGLTQELQGEGIIVQNEPKGHPWTLLYDGILPVLCGFCEGSVDSHFKFHAATAMQICLQQIKTSVCGGITQAAFESFRQSAILRSIPLLRPYDPLPAAKISHILQLIWNNWEDPLTQTVKQFHVVFDLLVDVRLVHKPELYGGQLSGNDQSLHFPETATRTKTEESEVGGAAGFLREIANDLLAAGRYRKGKYVPLASLVLRIGAWKMLLMSPDLLFQTITAFSDDDVCSSASTFLKTFLERLKEDCWSAQGVVEGTAVARRLWIPALLSGLLTGDPRLRNNLTTYALPVALQVDSDSLPIILAYILQQQQQDSTMPGSTLISWEEIEGARGLPEALGIEQQVVLLISFLKVARSLALVEGSIEQKKRLEPSVDGDDDDEEEEGREKESYAAVVRIIKGQSVEFPVKLLLLALTHKEDGVRVDTAELMCLNPKTASMPAPLELRLLKIALPLNMRCSSTAFRMRWTSFLKKFFLRVRTAVERELKSRAGRASLLKKRNEPAPLVMGNGGEYTMASSAIEDGGSMNEDGADGAVTLEQMEDFMQWLSQMLVSSLYPSAPYARKNMALEVFSALIDVWSLKRAPEKKCGQETADFSPHHESLLSADFTLVVVGAMVDSWDRLREGAFRVLIRYPTPLPGLVSESSIELLLRWAKGMVSSPRVRESDAGALAFRLTFRKYVMELGWCLKVHPKPKVLESDVQEGRGEAVVEFVESLCDWLEWGVEEGDRDLLKACAHSFVHGVLLVLRYTFDEIDWTSAHVQSAKEKLRSTLARLLSLLLRVTSLALWVVSADALNLKEKLGGDMIEAEMDAADSDILTAASTAAVDDEYESDVEESVAPAEQMVMVGCWLSVKEVSLLFGTIARTVPLPGSPATALNVMKGGESGDQRPSALDMNTNSNKNAKDESPMLDGKQLEAIGSHFVQVLLSMKHNGAIDKTRTGFIALCDRLLRSSDPWLSKLPEVWLQQLMDYTGARGQVVDDLLRRSAGIPPAFLALFLAEPDGLPKKLLPMAMCWLIDSCKGFLEDSRYQSERTSSQLEPAVKEQHLLMQQEGESPLPVTVLPGDAPTAAGETRKPVALKIRDEGVVPTVHALNVMRMTFHDTNLATDTSGFCAEGLITAIRAFSSSYWEVRNSATLAFTALVHRTIGFLNVYKRESARRAITGFEFFHRYPTLHPFLLQELQSATQQLEQAGAQRGVKGGRSGLASLLHPSLCPVLIILSRLKPSYINSDVEDWLNPSAFIPYVNKCAMQKNLHVRMLASQALAPLVPAEDLQVVLLELAQSLPLSPLGKEPKTGTADLQQPVLGSTHGTAGEGLHEGRSSYPASSFNAIHGVLLQMGALLTSNCTMLSDTGLRTRIVTQVFEGLEKRIWLGSIKLCNCHVVTATFLDVLGSLLSLARPVLQESSFLECQLLVGHLEDLLSRLSLECLDDDSAGDRLNFRDSTRIGLKEKGARCYFQQMLARHYLQSSDQGASNQGFQSSEPDVKLGSPLSGEFTERSGLEVRGVERKFSPEFVVRLERALVDDSYEVRLITLKVLKRYFSLPAVAVEDPVGSTPNCPSRGKLEEDLGFLRPLVIKRLVTETHPPCIRRLLQLIYAWTLIDRETTRETMAITHPGRRGKLSLNMDPNSFWNSGLSARDFWFALLRIYNSSKQMKTREVAVRCLGGCLQQIRAGIVVLDDSISRAESGPEPEPLSDGICSVAAEPLDKSVKEVVDAWLKIAKVHSAASEPVTFRRATAEAMVASGILEDANWIGLRLVEDSQKRGSYSNGQEDAAGNSPGKHRQHEEDLEWYAKTVLSAWCMCIKLLEDEDLDLRQNLALSILTVVVARSNAHHGLDDDVGRVPAQVEDVIQVSFQYLSARFGQWTEFYDVIAEWILGAENDSYVITGDADMVRRLFDKEIDNHHEEELMCIQLCCLHLERLGNGYYRKHRRRQDLHLPVRSVTKSSPAAWLGNSSNKTKMATASWHSEFLAKWRSKYLARAKLHVQSIMRLKESVQWIGGVTNHQDTFKGLYRCLLGLIFTAPSSREIVEGESLPAIYEPDNSHGDEDKEFVRGLIEVTGHLRQLPLNPFVSNALVQVLQIYEQSLQVRLGSSNTRAELGSAFCPKFSPLFLIR